MKKILIFILLISSFLSAQENEIKLKEDRKEKIVSKKKKEKRKKRFSARSVNYDATNLWDAIRPILGPGVYLENEKVLFNTGALFSTSNKYAVWAVNGVVMGQSIPLGIEIQDILDVKVLRSTMETSRYGLQGSAGVIEITLKKD